MFEEVGKNYGAYTLQSRQKLANMNGMGYVFCHTKTKARVAVISNDDNNKVFNIGFRTPPKDDTGVPHIMEHSVLCGSEKFPIKDPFVELVKGSMNTFLNAMTYPDKTVYPVASCNNKDFQNLMDVYLDAVFHPNIYKYKEILMQEGWHYECQEEAEPIIYNGVVYNEMKGVYSSPESVLDRLNVSSLYPDNTYAFESGGHPDAIPNLTYEEFIHFHKKYYHPSNSYIYLYGDMDVQEKLDFIDQEYLSKYEYLQVDSEIASQKPFTDMKEVEDVYAITEEEETKDKTYLSFNVVLGEKLSAKENLAFQILDYVLITVAGAPVKRALINAGIGQDVASSYESSILQPMYSISAYNANVEQKDKFLTTLRETLTAIAEKGIDKKALRAAINLFEFQYRETNFGSYPKGLIYGLKMFDSWLYDDQHVFDYLDLDDVIEELKQEVDTSYFENLLKTRILSNPHSSLVVLKPEKNLAAKQDEALREKMKQYKDSLTQEQIRQVVEDTKELKAFQDREDTQEDLLKIPLLSISDIDKKSRTLINEEMQIEDTKVVAHHIFTNGITYLTLHFNMRNLPLELIPVTTVLASLYRQVDTEHFSYQDLASEINLYSGGITFSNEVYPNDSLLDQTGSLFTVKVKVLHNQLAKAMELVNEILFTSHIDDEKRLREILAESRLALKQSIMSSGHMAMSDRANSYISKSAKYKEYMQGMDFYDYLVDLCDHFEEKKDTLIQDLKKVQEYVFTKQNLLISITTDQEVAGLLQQSLVDLYGRLYKDYELETPKIVLTPQKEAYKTPSQVQYVACAGNFLNKGTVYTGSMRVLKMIFSYEYFWMNIRVKGGAYGCGCNFGYRGTGYFSSYRDPNLKETYDVYKNAGQFVKEFDVDDRTMTKYIIGAINIVDMPMTPSAYGAFSFAAYLTGRTNEDMQRERDEILSTTVEKIRELAPAVQAIYEEQAFATLGNAEKIEQNKELFDVVKTLE